MSEGRVPSRHVRVAVAGAVVAVFAALATDLRAFDSVGLATVAVRLAVIASVGASAIALAMGARRGAQPLLFADAATLPVLILLPLLSRVAHLSNDGTGLLLLLIVGLRLLPSVLDFVRHGDVAAAHVFAIALLAYATSAAWESVRMLPQGDQAHYLVGARALASGSFDVAPVYADAAFFASLAGHAAGPDDVASHALPFGSGLRLLQGYGTSLLALPGWLAGGVLGAKLVFALVAGVLALQVHLLLRDLFGASRAARVAWVAATFTVPLLVHAGLVFPNVAGALLLVTAFRALCTDVPRQPALAGLAIAATLLLTPRDAVAAFALGLCAIAFAREHARRAAAWAVGAAVALLAFSLAAYGTPLPFPGYVEMIAGRAAFYTEPTFTPRLDQGVLGLLFDRAFGLAGAAPWVFIGLFGVAPLLRARPIPARAALVVIAATVLMLASFRNWQGGWAPPDRYVIALIPLWTPFVAAGLAASPAAARALAVALLAVSALAAAALFVNPGLGYSVAESPLLPRAARVVLPSFALDDAPGAYARSLAGLVVLAGLFALGARQRLPRAPVHD